MPVPTETQLERIRICRECEYFKPRLQQCNKCGCIMTLKTRLIGARCPESKWGAYSKP